MKSLDSAALTEDGWNIGGRPKCRSLVEATGRCHPAREDDEGGQTRRVKSG
jgi:hypothetical protein